MTTAATHLQSAASSDREPFAAFVADELTRAALMRIGAERGWPTLHVLRGGVIEAVEVLSRVPTPRLIVLDLSDSADPILEITQMANVCEQETRLIVLGRTNDITLFREMIALGVDDYLLKPVSAELLAAAIDKLANSTVPGGEAERAGRLVVVTNARGGAGATSIAVNTAWLIAHEQGRRVALVDFDLHFGTAALTLDLEPGKGFADALENPDRIDGLFMERTMVRAGDNLFVLAADHALDRDCALGAPAVNALLGRLQTDFDCVVVDLPRTSALDLPEIVKSADAVVIASDLTLAGMRDAMRLADFVTAQKSDADVRLVINRIGQCKKAEMSTADFERNVESRLALALPFDPIPAAKSARLGRPLAVVAPKCRFVAGLRGLVRELSGHQPAVKPPLWRRLFGRRG